MTLNIDREPKSGGGGTEICGLIEKKGPRLRGTGVWRDRCLISSRSRAPLLGTPGTRERRQRAPRARPHVRRAPTEARDVAKTEPRKLV